MLRSILILLWLLLLFAAACSRNQQTSFTGVAPFDQTKFEPLHRAARTTSAALSVSTTMPAFRELVQKFAAEVAIAEDRAAQPAEKDLVRLFADACQAYKDSLDLWDASVKHRLAYDGVDLIGCYDSVPEVARRYNLECIKYPSASLEIYVIPKALLQYLWALADSKITLANAQLLGKPRPQADAGLQFIRDAAYQSLRHAAEAEKRATVVNTRRLRKELHGAEQAEKAREADDEYRRREQINAAESAEHQRLAKLESERKEALETIWPQQQDWKKLEPFVEAGKSDPGSVYVCPGNSLFHHADCILLRSACLPFRQSDLPSSYKACSLCSDRQAK